MNCHTDKEHYGWPDKKLLEIRLHLKQLTGEWRKLHNKDLHQTPSDK